MTPFYPGCFLPHLCRCSFILLFILFRLFLPVLHYIFLLFLCVLVFLLVLVSPSICLSSLHWLSSFLFQSLFLPHLFIDPYLRDSVLIYAWVVDMERSSTKKGQLVTEDGSGDLVVPFLNAALGR